MSEDPIDRLAGLIDGHSPRRVVVVVPDSVSARWVTSLLGERQCLVGARIVELEGLLRAGATELAGPGLPTLGLLARTRQALVEDPQGRFRAIADQPSYQREVLRCFTELERCVAPEIEVERALEGDERDAAMLGVFARFRRALALWIADEGGGWWAGQAPALLRAGHAQVSFLRRRAAAVGLGFGGHELPAWQQRLFETIGVELWAAPPRQPRASAQRRAIDLRLSCAGPEAEIAAVARLLRAEPELPSVVLAPAAAVPRWAARLGHRDVPIRAWVQRRARETGTARVVLALLAVLSEPGQARRGDLERVLFGAGLRVWKDRSDALGLAYPRAPSPADLRAVWEQQRASAVALTTLADRLRGAEAQAIADVEQRAQRFAWADAQLHARRERVGQAHALLIAAIERLAAVAEDGQVSALRQLLEDWDLLGRAARHGAESPGLSAARVVVDTLATEPATTPIPALAATLDHALAGAQVGAWVQQRSIAGGPAVWLLPYACASVLATLPERVILTGLERHPSPPVQRGPVSERLRGRLGLRTDAQRFVDELRELDERVASIDPRRAVVASWRHRDGAGSRRPPGPWIAGRQTEGVEQLVGVDALALATAEGGGVRPRAPIERALLDWRDDPLLRRRVLAIESHEAPELGPHTGELGVAVPAERPYSASALQSYAALPYRYFVEHVLGLRERERPAASASALLATEQGQVVHRALESVLAARLAATQGPIELATVADMLLAELLEQLAAGYRARAEHGQAEAFWASERDRWATEIQVWWQRWRERMIDGWTAAVEGPQLGGQAGVANASAATSGVRRRREPEVLVPAPFLLAVEWSPSPAGEPFELDLGPRTIPFVAAIDRIEIDPARQRLNVCDYKTGRPRWPGAIVDELRAGIHLQLPLYAMVVQQVLARAPGRLGLAGPLPVGALRLEYLQRPRPSAAGRSVSPQARGFDPNAAVGVDASGQTWTVLHAAAGFTLAFVAAIEAGRFAVVERREHGLRRGADRLHELMRVVPPADQRASGLPLPLGPLVDPQQEREVVR